MSLRTSLIRDCVYSRKSEHLTILAFLTSLENILQVFNSSYIVIKKTGHFLWERDFYKMNTFFAKTIVKKKCFLQKVDSLVLFYKNNANRAKVVTFEQMASSFCNHCHQFMCFDAFSWGLYSWCTKIHLKCLGCVAHCVGLAPIG